MVMNRAHTSAWGLSLLVAMVLLQGAMLSPVSLAATAPTLRQGIQYYNKGWLKNAIQSFQSAARRTPNNAQAHVWLGKALKQQGGAANQKQAIQAFETALKLEPNQLDALVELAELYSWQASTRARAVDLYTRALAVKPNQPAIQRELAQLLYWQGQYAEGLALAEKVADQYAKDKTWTATYAALLNANQQYDRALQVYETRLDAAQSKDFFVRQGYAVALLKTGSEARALTLYQQLKTQVNAKNPEQMNALAGLAYELKDFETAVALDTQNPRKTDAIRLRLARSHAKLGHTDPAIAQFNALYTEGRLEPAEWVEFADYLVDTKLPVTALPKVDLVEELYKRAIASGQDQTGTALKLARYYTRQPDRFTEAINFYTYVLEQQQGPPALKQEVVDYLKSNARRPGVDVNARFADLAARFPNDTVILNGFADVLSWEEATRPDALKLYVELMQLDPGNAPAYTASLNQVLDWHRPQMALLPLYNQVLSIDPTNLWAQRAIAQAYWQDANNHAEAYVIYEELYPQLSGDVDFVEEYSSFLASVPQGSLRRPALKALAKIYNEHSDNATVKLNYANLLTYEGKYGKALDLYDALIAQQPANRKALVGRSLALLWSGQRFKAADSLKALREQYPNSDEVALELARAYQAMGRYDKAMNIIREMKRGMGALPSTTTPTNAEEESWTEQDETGSPAPAGYENETVPEDWETQPPVTDPSDATESDSSGTSSSSLDTEALNRVAEGPLPTVYPQVVLRRSQDIASQGGSAVSALQELPSGHATMAAKPSQLDAELERLDQSLHALKDLQRQTEQDLDQMDQTMRYVKQRSSLEMSEQRLHLPGAQANDEDPGQNDFGDMARQSGSSTMFGQLLDEGQSARDSSPAYGVQALSGDRYTNLDPFAPADRYGSSTAQSFAALEEEINLLMRPVLRTGFLYSTQEGDDTTNALRSWAFPNTVEFSLTPQVRMRGGYALRRFYLPERGILPRSTFAHQYSVGTTAKLLDRLTFDGDFSITQFTQSDSSNITYQARLITDITDRVRWQVGMRRIPNETSLLAFTGLQPNVGPFAGALVGQVRENGVFTELNLTPWRNWDLNLGYEFAWIDGENVPDNTRNQAYASLGYTWRYLQQHNARLGYEFLYFGYNRNATNGFVDLVTGRPNPVASLQPVANAAPGTIFGGYFSPETFFLNSVRLDLRGYWLGRILEYQVGGALGVQAFNAGIPDSDPTTAAYQFNALLIANLSEAVSLYGLVDYLDSGGLFNRWRFGGGLIFRPNLPAISPVFGKI